MDLDVVMKKIVTLAAQNDDIDALWIYGSRAQSCEMDSSDYDIAIAFKNFNLSPTSKLLRPNELAIDWANDLAVDTELISIVDINTVPVYLAFNIVEYGEVIYSSDTGRVFKEQDRIYSRYEFDLKESVNNE
jgi:predicted nucleotidyltransferase